MSLPNAITREDFYLNKIANPSDDHELPDAITRQQHYLKAIAENGGSGGGGGNNYSTTEQVIGTWIDGSPLYKRTFEFNNLSGTSFNHELASYGINFVNKIEGAVKLGEQGEYQWITSPYIESAQWRVDCHWQSSGNRIEIKSDWGMDAAIVTIYYIKST